MLASAATAGFPTQDSLAEEFQTPSKGASSGAETPCLPDHELGQRLGGRVAVAYIRSSLNPLHHGKINLLFSLSYIAKTDIPDPCYGLATAKRNGYRENSSYS